MRIFSLVLAVVVSCLGAAALWFWFDRPVPVEPSWSQPLRSVSFAPFRRGQSPLTKVYPTPQQVEEDLQSLVGKTRGIRTYTSREGMEVVPDLAAKYGLKVIQGAWLGSEVEAKGKAINEAEITALIKAANDHPNEIERVLVGNEVLLRGDLKPAELIAYIRRVKAAVKQPVSYADVWAFYLKYPEVAREVDYITIHILPFWEDEPVDIDHVEPHIVKIVERIRTAFPGKPILIGEAGWPSIGRDRGPAVVNTVNSARFVRQMAATAEKYDFDYNVVEAFDQPWKSALENTVGAAWGMLDIDRKPKFGMSGPVTEVADWPLRAGLAIGFGALVTVIFGRRIPGLGGRLLFAVMVQLLSWLAVTTCFHANAVSFRWWQDIWTVFRGGFAVVFAIAIVERASLFLSQPRLALTGTEAAVASFGRTLTGTRERWNGEAMTLGYGVYAFVWTMLLAFDGRYRDIPEIDFSVPAIGLTLLILIRVGVARRQGGALGPALALEGLFSQGAASLSGRWHQRLVTGLARGLVFASAAAIVSEGLSVIGEDFVKDHPTFGEQLPMVLNAMIDNREMIVWAVMLLAMALPYLGSLRLQRRGVPKLVTAVKAAE
ncbi:MAG TPA: exo-beta-1,3-glucanase [Patescibacteria group bacterium]|nr:exo-beta-1,3-glucanase [Patescibacteria group bacterium]